MMFWKLLIINLLTLLRVIGAIILVPIYNTYGGFYVGILVSIGYLTDSIDGILARRFHASTFFGALFDGFADKLFTIMNFIVLYLITPYALIPIIFEVLVIILQLIKYHHNLNIKSNMVGKLKVWILAFSVVLTFLMSDINTFNNVFHIFRDVSTIPLDKVYFYLLIPAILMEILTLISYFLEIFKYQNTEPIKVINNEKTPNIEQGNKWTNFKEIWLNPEYYAKHKNDKNTRNATKISKK